MKKAAYAAFFVLKKCLLAFSCQPALQSFLKIIIVSVKFRILSER